nr:hypothetical protein [Lysinibacillus timonensis]
MKITDWIALLAAGIALFGAILAYLGVRQTVKASRESSEKSNDVSIKLGKLSEQSQGKQRLIETVSAQRVEWINKVREYFSQLSKVLHIIAVKRSNNEEISDIQFDLIYLVNHIELFLNPTEIITNKFIEIKDEISNYLLNDKGCFSWNRYRELMLDLHYLEQVILKSEWKRLKEETIQGSEVKDMEKIHKEIAEKIDPKRYMSLLKKDFE